MGHLERSIFIGFDPREATGFAVARSSARALLTQAIPIYGVCMSRLQAQGLYTRPTKRIAGRLVDELSIRPDYDGTMSTEHAIARFFVPHLAPRGWALFLDGDVLIRDNLVRLFEGLDPRKAVYCVKHDHRPARSIKKNGQKQSNYARKNWSSVMVFNCEHISNRTLTLDVLNTLPGRDLHCLSWLDDKMIGELDPRWNWLVGYSDPIKDPAIVHFTNGLPDLPGYELQQYADEWRHELEAWALGNLMLDDIRKSVAVGFAAIRERVAAGGTGWTPK